MQKSWVLGAHVSSWISEFKMFSHTKMEISINCITINGVRYIPETTQNTDDAKKDKKKAYKREYYKKNKEKWKQYNETKKSKQKDLRTVIEFY